MLKALQADLTKYDNRRKLLTYYPDAGPCRRELYVKHLEHFAAGAEHRERLFMAGNRCISPWTWVETPDSTALAAIALTELDGRVLSWDGESRCAAPVVGGHLVGIEPAYRLVMGNGQFVDCSCKHRLLTTEGWLSIDQLVSRASGLRCWHTVGDYQASCVEGGHLCDLRPQSRSDSVRSLLRLEDGVRIHSRMVFSQADAEELVSRYIHASRLSCLPSNLDDPAQLAGLFALFAAPACLQPVLQLTRYSQERMQCALAFVQLQSLSAAGHDLAYEEYCEDVATLSGGVASRPKASLPEVLDAGQSRQWVFRSHSVGELAPPGDRVAIFYPCNHVPLIGGQTIALVAPLGFQPIIDAQVPGINNYFAGGVINHNCGKSTAGAYETTLHLTGRYPDWWVGRRFGGPVEWWAAGKTNETTRDIVQRVLFGEVVFEGGKKTFSGTGMVPGDDIADHSWKQGVNDLADTVEIRHVSGGLSRIGLKSYQQGRGAFEGTAQHGAWIDEEPDMDVFVEILMRTMTTDGIVVLTFTPLAGWSQVVSAFLQDGAVPT